MNLPDRLSDPIDENWQDRRSAESEYSSFSNKFTNSKQSADFDYRDVDAQVDDETDEGDTFQKRESKAGRNFDEVKRSYCEKWTIVT